MNIENAVVKTIPSGVTINTSNIKLIIGYMNQCDAGAVCAKCYYSDTSKRTSATVLITCNVYPTIPHHVLASGTCSHATDHPKG